MVKLGYRLSYRSHFVTRLRYHVVLENAMTIGEGLGAIPLSWAFLEVKPPFRIRPQKFETFWKGERQEKELAFGYLFYF